MPKLTVIVPTYNEEDNLQDCLETVRWADEILVVDSFSTDRTIEIAKTFGATVIQHEYVNSATQKNWTLPQANHDWVLIVDADERLTPALQEEIQVILQQASPTHNGYWIRRVNYVWGRPIRYCGWQNDKVLRLFDRQKGRYEEKEVHAEVEVQGATAFLINPITHHTYRDLNHYFQKFERYTDWGAMELYKQGKKARWDHMLFYPPIRFLNMYILKLGFLDGLPGLILCVLSSFYVFTKYAKLWQLNQKQSL